MLLYIVPAAGTAWAAGAVFSYTASRPNKTRTAGPKIWPTQTPVTTYWLRFLNLSGKVSWFVAV